MFKFNARKLAFALLLVLLATPSHRALAAGTNSPPTSTPTTTSPTTTPNGVTGTDPEPIEPDLVSLILTLLNQA